MWSVDVQKCGGIARRVSIRVTWQCSAGQLDVMAEATEVMFFLIDSWRPALPCAVSDVKARLRKTNEAHPLVEIRAHSSGLAGGSASTSAAAATSSAGGMAGKMPDGAAAGSAAAARGAAAGGGAAGKTAGTAWSEGVVDAAPAVTGEVGTGLVVVGLGTGVVRRPRVVPRLGVLIAAADPNGTTIAASAQ